MNNFLYGWNINFLCFWPSMIQKYWGSLTEHPFSAWLYIFLERSFWLWEPINFWFLWHFLFGRVSFSLFLGALLSLGWIGNWQRMLAWESLLLSVPRVSLNERQTSRLPWWPSVHGHSGGVVIQRPGVPSCPSLACSHCLYFLPILGAVNLSLYLQPQQGAHFHRREDSFNKSSSFVQEWCSHWLEGWLELWLS